MGETVTVEGGKEGRTTNIIVSNVGFTVVSSSGSIVVPSQSLPFMGRVLCPGQLLVGRSTLTQACDTVTRLFFSYFFIFQLSIHIYIFMNLEVVTNYDSHLLCTSNSRTPNIN